MLALPFLAAAAAAAVTHSAIAVPSTALDGVVKPTTGLGPWCDGVENPLGDVDDFVLGVFNITNGQVSSFGDSLVAAPTDPDGPLAAKQKYLATFSSYPHKFLATFSLIDGRLVTQNVSTIHPTISINVQEGYEVILATRQVATTGDGFPQQFCGAGGTSTHPPLLAVNGDTAGWSLCYEPSPGIMNLVWRPQPGFYYEFDTCYPVQVQLMI
ncbi:hypothetical protein C8Q80DRAFT_164857 [Daedaleopsis nitida]|nr:hypothetical protein C8Q80DRAFT_164857 [Daedaleopsis nitida]